MVRLKDTFHFVTLSLMTVFQFQYGAIKSISKWSAGITRRLFQFQYGAIKSASMSLTIFSSNAFQFQYGAIKSVAVS